MKRRLNTETRNRVFSLSVNEVGGLELLGKQRKEFIPRKREEGRKAERTGVSESLGRGEVVRETQIPSPCPSPRFGGARGKAPCISKFVRVYPSRIAGSVVKK